MKIVDCFIFYNEIELLNYRLSILYDIVDYFIIVESTSTFTGYKKKMFFTEYIDFFRKYINKITYIIVDMPYKHPDINIGDVDDGEQWKNEYFQRNSIKKGIDNISLDDDDIVMISDVDEIPDPSTIFPLKDNRFNYDIVGLDQDFYYYNLNSKLKYTWLGTKILKYKKFKEYDNIQDIRNDRNIVKVPRSGWHLSYFGDEEIIRNKILGFSHNEYNTEIFTNTKYIKHKINMSADLFERDSEIDKIKIEDNDYLPSECEVYLQKFMLV